MSAHYAERPISDHWIIIIHALCGGITDVAACKGGANFTYFTYCQVA